MTYQLGPELTNRQRQIIYGTILGGSSIVKPANGRNCYLAMRDKDEEWLGYKLSEISCLFRSDFNPIKRDKGTFRCYSISYPVFNEFYDEMYENGIKTVKMDTLNILNDLAWMIWFIDSGKKNLNKATLRTHKFGEEGSQIICQYFNELNVDCEVHKGRGRFEIAFSEEGTINFIKTFVHCLPPFLLKRLE